MKTFLLLQPVKILVKFMNHPENFDKHQHLETIQVIIIILNGSHLIISSGTVIEPGASNGVNLVEKYQTRLLGSGHFEQLPHHAGALAHVLLHQLGSDDPDEAGVGAVGHGPRAEGLAGAGRAEKQDAFWRFDAEFDEFFGLKS